VRGQITFGTMSENRQMAKPGHSFQNPSLGIKLLVNLSTKSALLKAELPSS
jgi:hypothetical protein